VDHSRLISGKNIRGVQRGEGERKLDKNAPPAEEKKRTLRKKGHCRRYTKGRNVDARRGSRTSRRKKESLMRPFLGKKGEREGERDVMQKEEGNVA